MPSTKYYRWQSFEKKDKRGRFYKKIVAVITILGLGFLGWFLFWSETFRVKDLIIRGNDRITSSDVFQLINQPRFDLKINFINEFLKPLGANLFWVSRQKLKSDLASLFPDLYDIEIQKEFPGALVIYSKERRIEGIWCAKEIFLVEEGVATSTFSFDASESGKEFSDCFYLDAEGVIFAPVPLNFGSLILKINDFSKKDYKVGERVIEPGVLKFLKDFREALAKGQINIISFVLGQKPGLDYVAKTSFGFKIYFIPAISLETTLNNFRVLGDNFLKNKLEELDYIDLRIRERAFYKLK